MTSLNLRYLVAATLLDGGLTFAAAHDDDRVHAPEIERITRVISIRARADLASAESPRQGLVEFVTRDGRTLANRVVTVRGAMENPMTTEEVAAKARELLRVALPADRSDRIVETVLALERLKTVSELATLLNPA
jgi:hypothetical protein